jgi:hypothetical protein
VAGRDCNRYTAINLSTPGAINWTLISLMFALGIVLAGNLVAPLIATA